MAEDLMIRAEGLGKKYVIGHAAKSERYIALRDVLVRGASSLWHKTADMVHGRAIVAGDSTEELWALKDVSFELKRGEVLGIIGRNGAGKSTLLKILSRVTEPSEGRVTIKGRVASLLEVGTGFHPELTGRENIYLNGAILGMTRAEIGRKFDDIVAFAEVEKFLDTPVKRYSSGMYVRLAFAVAAHLEPEILVVDEVLAVGDAEFQEKCLGKMDESSHREGRTVLLVSHNMGAINRLCRRVLWLDRGRIRECGPRETLVARYLARSPVNRDRVVRLDGARRSPFVQADRLRLTGLEWLTHLPLRHGEPVRARVHFETNAPVSSVSPAVAFNNREGGRVLTYHMYDKEVRREFVCPGKHSVDLLVNSLTLGPGIYNLEIGFTSGDFRGLDSIPDCAQVEVVAGPKTPARIIAGGNSGVRLEGEWCWNTADHPPALDAAS
jgi:lipopolysaccharide transport system ATP-binding protein